jgi:DNA repair photolyase
VLKPISNPPNPWDSTHVEYLGEPPEAALEVFEEDSRSILAENESPDVGFRWSLNPYRGCFHACSYCQSEDTPILMASGRTNALADIRIGDEIYGTVRAGRQRILEKTHVLNHWRRTDSAYRVRLQNGIALVASADHKFLTARGWRNVAAGQKRHRKQSQLSPETVLLGIGENLTTPESVLKEEASYRVKSVEPLGALPLYDITTGTGDFIANGVVSHNCYARTSHEYLGFGAGTDFDRKIVVKVNAAELLRQQLLKRSWEGETIVFSGNTDCYQPLEAVYGLTRRCLEICAEFRNPVAIITKGALVRRDVQLLARMARETSVFVSLSSPFSDDAMSRAIEPNASLPSQRMETLRLLSEAGIRTGVGVAPVIPGLNDSQISAVLERARAAGATSAFMTLVRLAGQTLPVFRERLEQAFPDRAAKIWSAIRQVRGGKLNESEFGARMHGVGPRWAAIRSLFDVECRRLGFNEERTGDETGNAFRRPAAQRDLFDSES